MAVFDTEQQKVIVRIVYDGPGFAGKTTNLRELGSFFTSRRRSEVVSPAEAEGRTLYFDWMQLDGGLVGGHALRCELLSAPGQAVLAVRRWHLVRGADAIVFVCDSHPSALEEARHTFLLLRNFVATLKPDGEEFPLIVQANKQDREGALAPDEVLAALGAPPTTPVVGARAHEAHGVRETAVLAIRAAANAVQRALLAKGTDAIAGRQRTPDEILAAMKALDPRESELPPRSPRVTPLVPSTPVDEAPPAASAIPSPAISVKPEAAPVVLVATSTIAPELVDQAWTAALEALSLGTPSSAPPRSAIEAREAPPLPRSDVASGWIWPAHGGREILRGVEAEPAPKRRDDLVARHGTSDGSGTSDTFIFEAAAWCVKTSQRRRFADAEDARAALVRLARRKIGLGPLLPKSTALSLQAAPDGGVWLWTVTPWVTTLRAAMSAGASRGGDRALGEALAQYARAAAEALALAVGQGIALDVHPSNFAATSDGALVYLDDDIGSGRTLPAIGHALLRRVDEYAARGAAIAVYVDAIVAALGELTEEERDALGLHAAIGDAYVSTSAGREARARLIEALARLEA